MRLDKNELTKKISQMKSILPKNPSMGALQGILLKDGYVTASNTEVTVKAKLEGVEGCPGVIPAKMIDFISSLPAGDMVLDFHQDMVVLEMGEIKNKFKTFPADGFAYERQNFSVQMLTSVSAARLKKAMGHVINAIPTGSNNQMMNGMYFECKSGRLNIVGLDGHRAVWDSLELDGDFQFIVPKATVEKLLQLDLNGDIRISCDQYAAIFETEDYEVYTRLIDGNYFAYRKMFIFGEIHTSIEKKLLVDAINRAKLCGSLEDKVPVVLDIKGTAIQITYKSLFTNYQEEVPLQTDVGEGLRIAFNPKFLLDSLKVFENDKVQLIFTSAKFPVAIKADDSDMTALVLPVNFKEA